MSESARMARAKSVKLYSTERPFSNFDLIEGRFGRSDTLPRLMSQVRCLGGKSMVVEELKLSADLVEENEDLRTATGRHFRSRAYRLSFFTRRLGRLDDLRKATDDDFVGYTIVKKDNLPEKREPCHVYESVIRKGRYLNNFIRGEQAWGCSINGLPFTVNGYLFAQQNKVTNVCAHAAIRTSAARFRAEGDLSYREMNRIVGIDHKTKRAEPGLGSDEITTILESAGARCFVSDFTLGKRSPVPFQRCIYGSIESGFPAIIFFGTASSPDSYHTIPVFGHTFNQDTWVPSADRSYFRIGAGTKYIPSDSWLSMFIGHDDNWGSNLCIPRHYLQTKRHPKPTDRRAATRARSDAESVACIIATVPKHVQLSPIRAEAIGAEYLFSILPQIPNVKSNKWSRRLKRFANESQLVLRPIVISGREYTAHLKRISDWEGERISQQFIAGIGAWVAGETLWMIELSIPELFSANKRKVGEVLLRADYKPGTNRDLMSFFFARLPGCFALYESGGASRPKYRFFPSGAEGHVELFGCEDRVRRRS
jgi:hypothetical protein